MGVMTGGTGGLSWIRQGATIFPRSAEENLLNIYNEIFLPFTQPLDTLDLIKNQRKSVNDLVRADITSLRNDPRMSKADQDRLSVHLNAIRETEIALGACAVPPTLLSDVQNYNQSSIAAKVTVIGKLAALAIACGVRQSVLVNIGVPQDVINYTDVAGAGGYEFHAISHRQVAENDPAPLRGGAVAPPQHRPLPSQAVQGDLGSPEPVRHRGGKDVVDAGANVHFSDLGSGQHIVSQLPYLYVGGVSDKLVTGQYIQEDKQYLVKF